MNTLAIKQENAVVISDSTKELIRSGVSENTLKAYRRAFKELDAWMAVEENGFRIDTTRNGGHGLNDAVLAAYLTHLHESGKSPSTIAQVCGCRQMAR